MSGGRCRIAHQEIRMSDFKESSIQISPGFEIKVLEVKGWGWTGNENAYGLVIWPGARAVAKVLSKMPNLIVDGCKVVELGAGSGLCSLVCAARGAQVVATDLNLEPLNLAKKAAAGQGLTLSIQQFDILGSLALPPCDVLVLADCIYTPELGRGVARRVLEAKARGATVVVGSSVNRPGYAVFREELARTGLVSVTSERVVDFSSPLWLLDVVRGNYIQEVTVY
jgi:predicted nicotinamide N-methyase